MKKISSLTTPSFLVNLDTLEKNIAKYQTLADKNCVELFPMLKTHKSSEITKMQIEAGAKGVLVGTLDEAEAVVKKSGVKKVMLAYPVIGDSNLERVIELNKCCELFVAFDNEIPAAELAKKLNNTKINYQIIINSGLNRFGVTPENAVSLLNSLNKYPNLVFKGISTHTGQVYGFSKEHVKEITEKEITTMTLAKNLLIEAGANVEFVATGTTPTFEKAIESDDITVSRPGNYVFFDAIQVALGAAKEEECSLTVLATVISNPSEDLYILDCGSKCLGLDQGAHGNSLTKGFGIIKNHPELTIIGLSEEVAKVKKEGPSALKIGDKIEIIPNHSCSAANMTNYLIGHRNGSIEKIIEVDIRGNSRKLTLD
ncbi:alanine racemase [uncultured Cetobacterium sp.]|uniref:alanine racemase n=1 Tax=uncultured Cetobacterium sp. TaxID=527638 RepID=UPI0026012C92|nr:alanine racemase [uncultured Cetobacterium sp.]